MRLIDADALEKWMKRDDWGTPDERWRPESEFGAIIDAQPTVGEWISVKERLPQDEQWVAALLYGFVGAIRNPISLQYNAMKRVFIDEDGIEFDIDDVAYWVGLPELPEEKKGEEE